MQHIIALCFLLALSIVPAHSRGEFRVGGTDGNPWPSLRSEEGAGEYWLFDPEGQLVSTEPVGVTPHGVAADTLIDFADNAIGPRFIDPSVNLTLIDPNASDINTLLPYTGGQIQTTDGCSARDDQIRAVKKQFDGDFTTAHFRRFTAGQGIFSGGTFIAGVTGEGWKNSVVIDFRTAVPVNRIRFLPRLGQKDDILLIEELTEPKPPLEAFGEDSFAANYLAWYELRKGDNTLRFANSSCDRVSRVTKGLRWIRNQDPELTVLKSNRENLDPVVELRFPTESIRYITAQAFPLRDWEVAEFEVYGEGFVEETVLVTQILDFGQSINWGKIRWDADVPEGTRIEVRTRTGNSPDPSLYFAENINGDIRPITLAPTKNSTRPVACPPCTTPTTGASGRRPTTLPRACATAPRRLRRGATARRFCRLGRAVTSSSPFACSLPLPPLPASAHSRSNSAMHRPPAQSSARYGPLPSIPSRPRNLRTSSARNSAPRTPASTGWRSAPTPKSNPSLRSDATAPNST